MLGTWLAAPHVREWWNHDPSPDAVEDDFGDAVDGAEPGEDWIAELDGRPIGLIQYSRFADYPDYAAEMEPVYPVSDGDASIDYLGIRGIRVDTRSDEGVAGGAGQLGQRAFVAGVAASRLPPRRPR